MRFSLKALLWPVLPALVASQTVIGTASADKQPTVAYGTHNVLPVSSGGDRFMSDPWGEASTIHNLSDFVKNNGQHIRISSRGMELPNHSLNRVVSRYDFLFPVKCGAVSFSYYEGQGFSALGLHQNGKVVLDVLSGGSPYSAPRLWGAFDQVVNDPSPMRVVVAKGGESGYGMSQASFQAGKVTTLSSAKLSDYGNAYQAALHSVSACVPNSEELPVLVKK